MCGIISSCSRSYASPLLFGPKDKYKIGRPARLKNSLAGFRLLRYGNPTNHRRSMFAQGPRTGGRAPPPPSFPRGGVNNSIRNEISRDAKHVGETRRCTRRDAARRGALDEFLRGS